ncbi:MAG: GIY-YIG nuclease family protein [Anaerolineae bacterium]|jgi:Uri superfamily endonuclease|nr:GIY-YIG nuclease family protein [Anaerolineae bacterium]
MHMDKGVYLLVLHLPQARSVDVGALGKFHFPAGWYVYVGSAHGPGGLGARLRRHRSQQKALRWHVDYLRAVADSMEAWAAPLPRKWECEWARHLLQWPGALIPAPGFGASDCCCASHLVRLPARPDGDLVRALTDGAASHWEET